MQNSVLSGAQTADTVSSLISISLDSMDQDLSVLDEQVDGLSEGDTYSTVQNSTESVKSDGFYTYRFKRCSWGD